MAEPNRVESKAERRRVKKTLIETTMKSEDVRENHIEKQIETIL